MTITAKCLIESKFAANSDHTEYPAFTGHTIIDKFTATNTDGSSQTISVNIIPSGGSVGASNLITSALSITAGASVDLPELKNHILNPGDVISCVASIASKVVIRASGREVT